MVHSIVSMSVHLTFESNIGEKKKGKKSKKDKCLDAIEVIEEKVTSEGLDEFMIQPESVSARIDTSK